MDTDKLRDMYLSYCDSVRVPLCLCFFRSGNFSLDWQWLSTGVLCTVCPLWASVHLFPRRWANAYISILPMADFSAETHVSLDVCSPAGSVSILPTVLYLLLGVLRELVHWPTHSGNTKSTILNWKAYRHYNGAIRFFVQPLRNAI